MADTKQYIIGTSDQAGKLKHKDYIEWVDSETGFVVKAPGTTSTDKANGDILYIHPKIKTQFVFCSPAGTPTQDPMVKGHLL